MKTVSKPVGGATFAPVTSRINLNNLQQTILTLLDVLPPSKWRAGVSLPDPLGGSPLRVYRDGKYLVFCRSKEELLRLNHGKKSCEKLEPGRKFRNRVKDALQRIAESDPEAAQIMANEG
jgi:hypothetical protein